MENRQKRTTIIKNLNKYPVWLLALFLCILLVFQSCIPKDSDFFSSFGTGDDIPENNTPTIDELIGAWVFVYIYITNSCNDQTGQFTANGTIVLVDENRNIIGIVFPDAGDSIKGGYERRAKTGASQFGKKLNGSFEGETEKVDIGNGYLAKEFWEGNFAFNDENPPRVTYEGTSRVDVTDGNNNPVCTIEYNVEGDRTGSLPQS